MVVDVVIYVADEVYVVALVVVVVVAVLMVVSVALCSNLCSVVCYCVAYFYIVFSVGQSSSLLGATMLGCVDYPFTALL